MRVTIQRYRNHIFLLGLIAFLLHGAKINSIIIGIDTEDVIHSPSAFYEGWRNTGRQGLVFLKYISNTLQFNPFFSGVLTLLTLTLAVSSFFLLWERYSHIGDKNSLLAWVVGGLFWIAHPIMTEQLYFSVQSTEICFGILMTALALWLIDCNQNKSFRAKVIKRISAVIILILAFSVYQALVPFYIFGAVVILFLKSTRTLSEGTNESATGLLKPILPYLGVFLVSFLMNQGITKFFFDQSSYLTDQIYWGKMPIRENLRLILHHVGAVHTGISVNIHYSPVYGLLCILTLLHMYLYVWRPVKGHTGQKWVVLLYLAALFCTPFLMTIVFGGSPTLRSQLVLPAITGFFAFLNILWVLDAWEKEHQRTRLLLNTLLCLICICGIWEESDITLRFYYTEQMRYHQDAQLGYRLIETIDQVREEDKLPILFIGHKSFQGNKATITGEIIGKSFFDYDVDVEPTYYWSSRRIIGFLHTLGSDYELVDINLVEDILQRSNEMPVWPAEGSVQKFQDCIIIKLSDANALMDI